MAFIRFCLPNHTMPKTWIGPPETAAERPRKASEALARRIPDLPSPLSSGKEAMEECWGFPHANAATHYLSPSPCVSGFCHTPAGLWPKRAESVNWSATGGVTIEFAMVRTCRPIRQLCRSS